MRNRGEGRPDAAELYGAAIGVDGEGAGGGIAANASKLFVFYLCHSIYYKSKIQNLKGGKIMSTLEKAIGLLQEMPENKLEAVIYLKVLPPKMLLKKI